MKKYFITNCKSIFLILTIVFSLFGTKSFGQEDKKNASLGVQYFKIMKEHSYLDISAKFKGKSGFEPCKDLSLNVYKVDTTGVAEPINMGAIKTHKDGKVKFLILPKFIGTGASYAVKVENNKAFEDNEEIVSVKDVTIEATIEKTDSLYQIKAYVLSANNKPIADETVKIGLKRLFGNLSVGDKESYTTDENGEVSVLVEKGYTGLDGKLNFQIIIPESESYGTVIANLNEKFGVPIVDKSGFNERTMWSPPTKAPLFLLLISNIILIGIWGILTYLMFNLYKIYKSKN